MTHLETPVIISVCMGSSCYSRGNRDAMDILQEFIETHHLEDRVELRGNLCEDLCERGPNIRVDGQLSCHSRDTLGDVMQKLKTLAGVN